MSARLLTTGRLSGWLVLPGADPDIPVRYKPTAEGWTAWVDSTRHVGPWRLSGSGRSLGSALRDLRRTIREDRVWRSDRWEGIREASRTANP